MATCLVLVVLRFLLVLSAWSQEANVSSPKFNWSRSLPIDSQSPVIGELGGTEARSLVTMGGKIYAGIGYWEDSETKDPRLPGGRVLVLDSSKSRWRVELQLDERITVGPKAGIRTYMAISALDAVTFHYNMDGSAFRPNTVLLAGVWKRDLGGGTEVFYRTEASNTWQRSVVAAENLPREAVRSFFLYRDKVTGIERVFLGTRVPYSNQPGGIYSGTFDSQREKIRWDPNPEVLKDYPNTVATVVNVRVASFAECNGKLYAAAYDSLYERQDGTSPVWIRVFQHPMAGSNVKLGTGFRGLTAVVDPLSQRQMLLVVQEAALFLS